MFKVGSNQQHKEGSNEFNLSEDERNMANHDVRGWEDEPVEKRDTLQLL
jgi:hypothetical protein